VMIFVVGSDVMPKVSCESVDSFRFFQFWLALQGKHFRQSGPFKWSTESRLALVKMYGFFSITPMVHHKEFKRLIPAFISGVRIIGTFRPLFPLSQPCQA
jgi:hypothetical protein